jgi:hypothetical protein
MKKYLLLIIIWYLLFPCLIFGYSKSGTVYTTDGSLSDAQGAVDDSSTGDSIFIPSGNYTWGADAAYLSIDKAVIVQGAGKGVTNITLSDTGSLGASGTIRITASAIIKGMTINGSDAGFISAISVGTANNWRITDIDFNGGTSEAYFIYVGNVYGLIDNNDITGANGSSELIFIRGPIDSWQTTNSIGGEDNVFIEDNTFNGLGYVCDANSNARVVVRYNTITGPMKIDGHGKASNTPARGVRHMEIYNNTWTNETNFWRAIEFRGGSGRIFDNVIESSASIYIMLEEFGCFGAWPNFDNTCQCPSDYPIDDQVGVGIDPKSGGSEPLYLWGNTKNGSPWTLTWSTDVDNCQETCGEFTLQDDIIVANRDYFISDTKPVAMAGYTPYTYPHPLRLRSITGMKYLKGGTIQ